ncbi:phosphatase PAP2 family protein [Streptomyces halstedii]|uniref:phosphatase PAP2 family protein n=1 Tax=Streptomyces halstedii TaxID=1944 RepID=UPI0036AA9D66
MTALLFSAVVFVIDALLVQDRHAGWIDQPVLDEAVHHRGGGLNTVMTLVTNAAEIPLILLSVLTAAALALRVRTWRPLCLVAVTGALSVAAATVVKNLTLRSRPPVVYWVVQESDYSFPSRHTTMTAALLPVLAYLLARHITSTATRIGVWAAAVLCTLLVATSRVYLGVHWATDVAGGLTLGTCVALAVIIADGVLRRRSA